MASTDRRGAETAALDLAVSLSEQGWPGSVVALERGRAEGLDIPSLGPSRFSMVTLRSLRGLAGRHSILVAHGSSTLPAVAAATVGLRKPFIYRSIGDPRAWLTTPARRLRVRAALQRAAGLVALWRGSAVAWHEMMGMGADRIAVIPNGVRVSRFRPAAPDERAEARVRLGLPPRAPIVLYLGALSPEKRVDLAVEAIRSVGDATLVVVGDGPERARVEAMATGSADRIRILGATREPWRVLAAADAVVVPSDTEGQPAVAIEAGLMGIPVVATRVGGLDEIVIDGRSGLLVEPGNAGALADGLRQVLDRPGYYSDLCRAHCLDHFAMGPIAEKWVIFLQSLIKTRAIPEQHSA